MVVIIHAGRIIDGLVLPDDILSAKILVGTIVNPVVFNIKNVCILFEGVSLFLFNSFKLFM